jgi:hypothetical protein
MIMILYRLGSWWPISRYYPDITGNKAAIETEFLFNTYLKHYDHRSISSELQETLEY